MQNLRIQSLVVKGELPNFKFVSFFQSHFICVYRYYVIVIYCFD